MKNKSTLAYEAKLKQIERALGELSDLAHKMMGEEDMSLEDRNLDRIMWVGFAADALPDLCPAGARIVADLTGAVARTHSDGDEVASPSVVLPFPTTEH